jgi:uncharacterized protein (DUF1330 family)
MSAYIIVDIRITDPVVYEEYKKVSHLSVKAYGGRFLVRGGRTEVLEGSWQPNRLVIAEFDSAERAREWWTSAEYREPKALRQKSSVTNMILVEGA